MSIIDKFNNDATILVISDYPEKVNGYEKNHGIAWYTKELLTQFARNYNQKFVVLAEKSKYYRRKTFERKRILVLRVFHDKKSSLFPKVLKWLLVFKKIKRVHVHSEFCANGELKNYILLLPFLLLIKLTGRHITYFAHNVVTDIIPLAPHLNLRKNSLRLRILNSILPAYYRILGLICQKIVILDEVLKSRIAPYIDEKKITCLPIWTEKKPHIDSKQAKKSLGLESNSLVVLYFGFVTYYKGADWLVSTFKTLLEKRKYQNIYLILAGGPAYSLEDKKYYKNFYGKLVRSVSSKKRIQITGFIPDKRIDQYFAAADLCIFPYRGLIGSSGALSYALSYRKPFIISDNMYETVLANEDFRKAVVENELNFSDITFPLDERSFRKTLDLVLDKKFRKKLAHLSQTLAEKRDISTLTNSYYTLFEKYEKAPKKNINLAFGRV